MKNKKLKIFVYLSVILGFLVSCRTDFVNEQIVKNNNASSLTSRSISLQESPHRQRLAPILSELNKNLNNGNKSQKSVNFGDSIIVDTDDIIMMENGSNYHTYTFKVKRTNAKPNDPVENLLLSALPNGTYREFWVTYNVSENEKQLIQNGGSVNFKNKLNIVELFEHNFQNLVQKTIDVNCGWHANITYTKCNGNLHHEHGELPESQGGPCKASEPSVPIITYYYSCDTVYMDDNGSDWMFGGGGNNGNTGGGAFPCPDCPASEPCVQVPTSPTPSTAITDANGCFVGLPTTPNIGIEETPCKKIKAQRADDDFKKRIDTLQGKTGLEKETGYIQKWGGNYEYKDNATSTPIANSLSLPLVTSNTWIRGFMHTHVDDFSITLPDGNTQERKGIKMFSPADVNYFMDLIQNAQNLNKSLNEPYAVMVTSGSNYQIRFTGSQYQIKTFTEEQIVNFSKDYAEFMENFINKPKKIELGFLQFMSEKMNIKGITLYRMNSDGTNTEINLNTDKTGTIETICPNK